MNVLLMGICGVRHKKNNHILVVVRRRLSREQMGLPHQNSKDDIAGRLSEATVYIITTLGSVNLEYFFWRVIGNVKSNYCGTATNGTEETQTATPASTHAKVKYEAEPEPSQRETEVTQLNAYTIAASEMATEKLYTTAENDNDGFADATVALPTTRAAEDEVFVKEKRPADFNNNGPLENDHDDNTQEEEPEQTTAAEEAEIPANNADIEVDVGREEILTDKEVKHRTNPEGDEVLEKVKEEIVGEETHEGEQCPREEVHAQSGTQDASKQNAPRREGESDALFNRPWHHSTGTKADALRMSDVENWKARERTRSPPGLVRMPPFMKRDNLVLVDNYSCTAADDQWCMNAYVLAPVVHCFENNGLSTFCPYYICVTLYIDLGFVCKC
ncbi:hypothetical protein FQA39_LY12251 [Lamprigera yunnana]|nr:hypothetical protein FQA39_LY12251 [Lamprigera yunnana]